MLYGEKEEKNISKPFFLISLLKQSISFYFATDVTISNFRRPENFLVVFLI